MLCVWKLFSNLCLDCVNKNIFLSKMECGVHSIWLAIFKLNISSTVFQALNIFSYINIVATNYSIINNRYLKKKYQSWDFLGSPVINKILCIHYRRQGFNPWLGNKDAACQAVWPKEKVIGND